MPRQLHGAYSNILPHCCELPFLQSYLGNSASALHPCSLQAFRPCSLQAESGSRHVTQISLTWNAMNASKPCVSRQIHTAAHYRGRHGHCAYPRPLVRGGLLPDFSEHRCWRAVARCASTRPQLTPGLLFKEYSGRDPRMLYPRSLV